MLSQTNHSLYYRHKKGKVNILKVYVDDIIRIEDDVEEMTRVKQGLASKCELKNLQKLHFFFFLG